MTLLLDHLTAIVVGAFLLGALAVFQQRTSARAAEAAAQYGQETAAADLAMVLERELENARGRAASDAAFAPAESGPDLGAATYRFSLRRATTADGTEYTSQAVFPTLTAPDSLSHSRVGYVVYRVEDTGETVPIDGRDRALLRATRYEYVRGEPVREAGVYDRVLDLDVVALGAGGTEADQGVFPSTPRRLRFELVTATAAGTSSRHARTVRALGAAGGAGLHTPDRSTPGGLPPLPGDGDAPPSGTGGGHDGPTMDTPTEGGDPGSPTGDAPTHDGGAGSGPVGDRNCTPTSPDGYPTGC